ncbi:MAG: UDP-3-O-(3-hydroxymyristoyl)glucosamine N-acyltransferase [Mongoliibacter sp.]|uniref:UDP-3-O-(3-hydroxymyristoyl)glucosamine N-acyltransferase n=1 Tax=Mongoliibacter sp. TaxID=2022438 RepID=UPI0012EFFA46|nr:UDP-3-O-(3-hydroxymyristoyl)glucosamine N-acyltransferase [Mongoliibacter sp.]TVP49147.1 MAG: UDP-3-O-(3-hydroxymyristoyl)glucosamine N-acyltransferase [Mongoliibacter sp.]
MKFTLGQIANILGGKVEGDENLTVNTLVKIQEGKPGGIGFLANEKYESHIYTTKATAIIVSEGFKPKSQVPCALIRVKDAYNGFTNLLEAYDHLNKTSKTGIEEPSFCDPSSTVGEGCYRAAFSYIGKNCSIGNNVKIHAHVTIGDNTVIGDNTILYYGAKIKNGSVLGKNCEIHSGAVIGSDGFGFAPQEDGTYKSIPQIGNVILEDYVSVGANTTIDCATIGSTIIRKGAKIDNLVQIAHNVDVGENTVIASQTGISGSTVIGKNCIIAGQVGIVGHITIADNTTIAAKTGISKSIKKPGQTIFGYMGMDIKDFLKSYSLFKNLPQIQDKLKELEKKQ